MSLFVAVLALMVVLLAACSEPAVEEYTGKKPESHYRDLWCAEQGGWTEARIPAETTGKRGTRCDCLTDTFAVEVEFCPKWAEAIGQSLYYAARTGEHPGIVLVCDDAHVEEFSARLRAVTTTYGLPITVWVMDSAR